MASAGASADVVHSSLRRNPFLSSTLTIDVFTEVWTRSSGSAVFLNLLLFFFNLSKHVHLNYPILGEIGEIWSSFWILLMPDLMTLRLIRKPSDACGYQLLSFKGTLHKLIKLWFGWKWAADEEQIHKIIDGWLIGCWLQLLYFAVIPRLRLSATLLLLLISMPVYLLLWLLEQKVEEKTALGCRKSKCQFGHGWKFVMALRLNSSDKVW
jgi:hypothetical protein